jgi:hypothetical protein
MSSFAVIVPRAASPGTGVLSDIRERGTSLWRIATAETRLGLIPIVSLVGALGLVIVALADTVSRLVIPGGQILFWLGYICLVLPFAIRLFGARASRAERVWLVVLLGLALYWIKILYAPSAFTLFDEFHHWATLNDILASDRLFTHNNILPASPFYPGLEIVTQPLVHAGLSVWEAGVLMIGIARLLTVLSLYLFVERIGGSARVAGIATLVYMANPSFLFFDAQYAYESLALALGLFTITSLLMREQGSRGGAVPLTVAFLLGMAAVIVTHHITAMLVTGFLIVWAIISVLPRALPAAQRFFLRRGRSSTADVAKAGDGSEAPPPSRFDPDRLGSPGLAGPALIALIGTFAWMLYVASVTVGYLAPALGGAVDQVLSLIAGEEAGRELFRASSGTTSPAFEQVTAFAAVAVLLASMALGGLLLWRNLRHNPAALTLGVVALAYPATLAGRFTPIGAELSARSAAFVFVGLSFVVALALVALFDHERRSKIAQRTVVIATMVVMVGGAILSFPYWARLPGSYLVSADPRSITPVGIDTATWMLDHLGSDNRIMTDRDNRILTKTYGLQHPMSAVGDQIDVKAAYFATDITSDVVTLLEDGHVRYVLSDDRLPTSLPYTGVYVERGEILNGAWTSPMPASALDKWNADPEVDRVYDAGPLKLYDVSRLHDAAN